jgi:hypothetical protein
MIFSRLFRQKRTRIELDLTDAQIDQLRTVVDGLPLDPYASLVVAVVKALPFDHESNRNQAVAAPSDAVARSATPRGTLPNSLGTQSDAVPPNNGADADLRTLTPSGSAGGFSLLAFTPKDAAAVRKIEQQLARLPHTGDL